MIDGLPVDPARSYRVAGSDWEFEPGGGYADPALGLRPKYDVPDHLPRGVGGALGVTQPG